MAVPSTIVKLSHTSLDLLLAEFTTYLVKSCDDTRAGREYMYRKLENAGFDAGRRLMERLSRTQDRLTEPLDIIKLLCRTFWREVFRKQIDKLQTNHKGVFVLQDFEFQWLKHMSAPAGSDTVGLSQKYLLFPCGLIRGALAALGLDCLVSADIAALPVCTFHIRIKS